MNGDKAYSRCYACLPLLACLTATPLFSCRLPIHPETWPNVGLLCRHVEFEAASATPLNQVLPASAHMSAVELLGELLVMDPNKRLGAAAALEHDYFDADPEPTPPENLPR